MCVGVSLTITPLLSLLVDQTQKKIRQSVSLYGGPGIHAHYITWTSCSVQDTGTTATAFQTPSFAIRPHQDYHLTLLVSTHHCQQSTMVAYVHFFVQFGLTFQQEFAQLHFFLFKKL